MDSNSNRLHRLAWIIGYPFLVWHLTPYIVFIRAPVPLLVLLGLCIVFAPLLLTLPQRNKDPYRSRTYVYSTYCALFVVLLWGVGIYLIAANLAKGRW